MSQAIDIGASIDRSPDIHGDRSPDIHGGRPRIARTGVTVHRIARWYKLGLTPEEISARIGHLTLAQVYAALAYYHTNRDTVEADLAEEDIDADRLQAAHALATMTAS